MNAKQEGNNDPQIWLDRAKSNLSLAKTQKEDVLLEDLCFEAQQATEKATKALLIYLGIDFPYTHDLAELLTLVQEKTESDIPEPVNQMPRLTRFAVAARYPGPLEPVTPEEYEDAISIAEAVVGWVEERVG